MLTQAERCSVFLVDKMTNELVAKVFDGTLVDGEEIKRGPEIRLPINKGVAGNHGYITTVQQLCFLLRTYYRQRI